MDIISKRSLIPGGLYKILITDYNITRWAIYYGLHEEHTRYGILLYPVFDAGENARVAYHPDYVQIYSVLCIMDGTISV